MRHQRRDRPREDQPHAGSARRSAQGGASGGALGLSVTRQDIETAADRIRGRVRRTPVLELQGHEIVAEVREHDFFELALKLEMLQETGSFKLRGAFNLLLANDAEEHGVVAASGGNFGLAVAQAAKMLGVDAHVFVPATSPAEKIDRLRDLGAYVHVIDGYYDDALAASEAHADGTGAFRAHAYDQPEVVAGQGTCGREFDGQSPGLDTVLVAVGGGGLIAGVATWFEGTGTEVVGVETEGCPTLHEARRAGRPVQVEVGGLCASSLGAQRIGDIAWEVSERGAIADSLLVTDEDVVLAQRILWSGMRLVAEPGGAAAFAALVSGAYRPEPRERVGVIVCGANTEPATVIA